LGAKVIRKFRIDTEDPTTVNYTIIYIYIEKSTISEKAIQRIKAERAPNTSQNVELAELVNRFQAVTAVSKEKKLAEPVVVLQPVVSTATDKTIDKLIQLFEKLNINIRTLVQQSFGQTQHLYYQYLYSRNTQAGLYSNKQNIGAVLQAVGVNMFTTRQNIENTCFYCYNCNPDLPSY
jgi:hypothetical protein